MALKWQKKKTQHDRRNLNSERVGLRLTLAGVFMLFLAAFLHFREVHVELLEIDASAKSYVVAQVDFQFPDPDHTVVLKQEAMRDVGRFYRIDEHEIKKTKNKFEDYLIHHPYWRRSHEATFEEMYKALEEVTMLLHEASFTDARTYRKRRELGLTLENFYVVQGLSSDRMQKLPDSFWESIERKLESGGNYSKHTIDFILDYYKSERWKVVHDIDTQRYLREVIEQQIPDTYTHVRAGSKLIDQGERVTKRHVEMLQAMKDALKDSINLWDPETIFASLIFSIVICSVVGMYLCFRKRKIVISARRFGLYITIIVLTLIFSKMCEWLTLYANNWWFEYIRYPIFVPLGAILMTILMEEELAIFSSFFLSVIMGVTLSYNSNYFLFMNLVTGTIAAISSKHLKKRKEVFFVCGKVWVAAAFVIFAFNLSHQTLFSLTPLFDFFTAALNMLLIAILLIGLLPALESLFNIMTDMALMEYMNPTSELLQRLSLYCPGTLQHSYTIGLMSEQVAYTIGANGLLCRVTTLYHDIGKTQNPQYYVENQMMVGEGKQFNIHSLLTPVESALIIKSHVKDGTLMARRHKLPQVFIDVIEQHHGTTLIGYFYAQQVKEMGGDTSQVDEAAFRYPGPKPQTKEAAIIMLADAIEAASRTLDDNSEETITRLVDAIVEQRITDGQFDECPLTFQELTVIKKKFIELLQATYHLRVKYPDLKKNDGKK